MTLANEKDILRHLKTDVSNLYLLHGDEGYLKRLYLQKLLDKYEAQRDNSFNYHKFDFSSAGVDQIADACMALPVFAKSKCVVVKDVGVESASKGEMDKLYDLFDQLPEETILIVAQMSVEMDLKKNAKSKKFLKAADEAGTVITCKQRSNANLIKFIHTYAEQNGCVIDDEAAQLLREQCMGEMESIALEMDKLCAYREAGTITAKDVKKVVAPKFEATIYDLSKAVKKGNYSGAMETISHLRHLQEEPLMVLGALSSEYVNLFRAKAALDQGYSGDNLKQDFQYRGREFLIKGAFSDASMSSWRFVERAIQILTDADLEMKSGVADGYIVLEKAVTELFVLQAEEK